MMPTYRIRNAVTRRLMLDPVTLYPVTFDVRLEAEQCAATMEQLALVGDGAAHYEVVEIEAWLTHGDGA
jgi:hypothetical protein